MREYELVLMLDPEAPDRRRDEIADTARGMIESQGTLEHADGWGTRKMTYEIRQRTEADYRFYRFRGERPLLEELNHSLKITGGVLRFRVFKVDSATPVITPPAAQAAGGRTRGGDRRREGATADRPPAEDEREGTVGPRDAAEAPEETGGESAEAEPSEPATAEGSRPSGDAGGDSETS